MKHALALLILLAFAAAALLLPARPTPVAIEPTPASVTVWKYLYAAPPQFCPTPLPVCQPDDPCPTTKETFT